MSSTSIRYQGAEFVSNDLFIELWLLEIANLIECESTPDAWLKELAAEWHLQATSGFGFGPSPALDRFLTTEARRAQLVCLFNRALELLSKRNNVVSAVELSQSGVGGPESTYTQGISTQRVIEVGRSFVTLMTDCRRAEQS